MVVPYLGHSKKFTLNPLCFCCCCRADFSKFDPSLDPELDDDSGAPRKILPLPSRKAPPPSEYSDIRVTYQNILLKYSTNTSRLRLGVVYVYKYVCHLRYTYTIRTLPLCLCACRYNDLKYYAGNVHEICSEVLFG